MTRFSFRLTALFVVAVATSGCGQGVGDRCQLDSDCSSGHCAIPAGGSIAQGGTCQAVNDAGQLITPTDDSGAMFTPDLTATVDMSLADQSVGDMAGDMATAAPDMAMPEMLTLPLDAALRDITVGG